MITAIIVDDEENNREGLAKMIDKFIDQVQVVAKAESAQSAKQKILELHPQLVFLDIEMPDGDGFSLLEEFDDPAFQVIFTTAHAEYAIKAIKFAALDYILKPVNLEELQKAVAKASANIESKANLNTGKKIKVLQSNRNNDRFNFQKIALPTLDGLDFYQIQDIIRCEADRAYCKFYLSSGKVVTVSKSLSEFEDLLVECNFFRVHKSHMVNLNHIKKYVKGSGGYVVLSDDSHVDVSVRRKEELMGVLSIR